MDAHLDLELAGIARLVEQRLQLLDHVGRRQLVVLGAGDVELALGLAEGEVRALDRVAHQPGAVERGGGGDAVGIARGGGQRIGPAHAIAVGADRALLRLLLLVGKGDQGGDVVHHRRDRHLGAHRPHAGLLGAALLQHVGAVLGVLAGAVIEVGQQHVVAHRRQPAGHVVELLADAGRVHQEQHRRVRPAPFRMANEGFDGAVLGRDIQNLLDHVAVLLLVLCGHASTLLGFTQQQSPRERNDEASYVLRGGSGLRRRGQRLRRPSN